jgi:ABC-2 type transport system permease protein
MTAELRLQETTGTGWQRGLRPLLRHELRQWWGGRRGVVQLLLWSLLFNSLLLFALYLRPGMATAEGELLSDGQALAEGQQMFFGLGIVLLALGAIVLLQDAYIEEKTSGTAEWVLSKPVSRSAYVLAKLLPNLLGIAVTMLLIPGLIGYFIMRHFDATVVTLNGFLASWGIVGLHLFFYITLTLLLGVLCKTRASLLGVALGSLFGGSLVPVAQVVQFTPWKLGNVALLPVMGQPLPPVAVTMLASTVVWSLLFIVVAIWQFNRQEM